MWNPFKKDRLISEEDFQFQTGTYKWLLRNFGGDDFYQDTDLILPTEEFFPKSVESQEEAVKVTFEYVRKYAGMEDWPCELQAQEPDMERKVAPTIFLEGLDNTALGTFSDHDPDRVIITYNPAIMAEPVQLVATFAHELAHYLTATCPEEPPGGWENWEFATDIAAVFMGFGVFLANSAFMFRQFSDYDTQGWSTSCSGYLSEAEYSYALAIFLKLKDIDPKKAFPYLRTNIKSYVKRALKELDANQVHLELKSVQFVPMDQIGSDSGVSE